MSAKPPEADIDVLSERTAELIEPPVVANQRHRTAGARQHSLDRR